MIQVKLFCLGIAILISLVCIYTLWSFDKPRLGILFFKSTTSVSTNWTESESVFYVEPGYFHSAANVSVALSSKYADAFKSFKKEVSLDHIVWTEVHLYSSLPNTTESSEYSWVGYIDLNKISIPFYERTYVPPQQLNVNATKEDVMNSLIGKVIVHSIVTPKDFTLTVLVFIAILGTSFGILNSLVPEVYNSYKSRN